MCPKLVRNNIGAISACAIRKRRKAISFWLTAQGEGTDARLGGKEENAETEPKYCGIDCCVHHRSFCWGSRNGTSGGAREREQIGNRGTMRKLGRKLGFPSGERNEWVLAKRTAADEVARKIREVRELGRRRKVASRKSKKFRTNPDYIERVRRELNLLTCLIHYPNHSRYIWQ